MTRTLVLPFFIHRLEIASVLGYFSFRMQNLRALPLLLPILLLLVPRLVPIVLA